MFRSPLMMGGELPSSDGWTTSLLTNSEVIAIDQHSTGGRPVITSDKVVAWVAHASTGDLQYVAIFNLGEASQTLRYSWKDLGFSSQKYKTRDLWEHKDLGTAGSVNITIPTHGVVLYGISPAQAAGSGLQ
jgi:hypothetical protein